MVIRLTTASPAKAQYRTARGPTPLSGAWSKALLLYFQGRSPGWRFLRKQFLTHARHSGCRRGHLAPPVCIVF
jgi:hypothetical protein